MLASAPRSALRMLPFDSKIGSGMVWFLWILIHLMEILAMMVIITVVVMGVKKMKEVMMEMIVVKK